MSLGHFILEICSNVWSFLSDRAHKEYLYLFKKGVRTEGDADRGNAYVNKIVEHFIAEKAHEYNPYIIEDKTYTWLRIPLIAEIEHLDTFVEGLISLHKEKSCVLTEKCGTLNVAANLGVGPLKFTICAWGKLFKLEKLITISASLNHCNVNADFSLNSKTGRNGRLHSLCIEEFKDLKISVTITGSRYLSWFFSKLFTLITIFSQRILRNLVEFELEKNVRKLFPFCELPIEGNVSSLREERTLLNQVEAKPFNCSNANNSKELSFKSEQTGESMKSLFMKNGYRINANSNENIHKVTDCNKEDDGEKETQLREEQTADSEISIEMERTISHTINQLLQDSEAILSHDSRTSHKFDDNLRRGTKILTSEEKQSESDSKIVLKINNTNASLASECHNNPSYPKTAFDWGEFQNLYRVVSCALPGAKQDKSIDLEKHVESILRWTSDSEDTEESKPYHGKINKFPNFDTKPRIQNNCSTLTGFLEKQSKISNSRKDSSKKRKVKRKLSRNTDLNSNRIEKNLKNVTSNNFLTIQGKNLSKSNENISCASNTQFYVIEDTICRNFGNSCLAIVPENTFFFEDNESDVFSHIEYANKQITPEFVEQPGLLENIIIPNLNKDVDCTMDLDHMLKPEMFLATNNKIKKQPTIQNFGLQDAAVSSKYYSILKVMKNFFEQNPIDNRLVEQNIPLIVSNVNARNVSCSSHVDFSGILTDKLFDSIPDACKESYDVFEVEKFNVEPPCLTYDPEMFYYNAKLSSCEGLNFNDSLSRSDSMFSEEGSSSSSSVRLNVSSENSSIFQDSTINDISESPEVAPDTGNECDTKLKLTPANYAYYDNNAKIVFDEAYFRIHADILLLLEEKSLDAELESEDYILDQTDQITSATLDMEERRKSSINFTEEFQMTDNIKSLQDSSFDQGCVETLDVLSEIDNEELKYISEQTKKLKVMFEKFAQHHKIQTSACPLPYLEPTCNILNGKFRLEDTDELKYSLSKENELSINIKDEGAIAESSAQDESTFEENELVSVEEGRSLEDVTYRNMHSLTNEKAHLVKVQDEHDGWFSSKKSVQGLCPWEVCKILDDKDRVSWKISLQIWGVETNTLLHPDSECSSQSRTK